MEWVLFLTQIQTVPHGIHLKRGSWNNYKDQQADWLGLYGIDGTGGGLDKDTADNGEVKETGTAINEQEIVLTCSADATCPKNPLHSGTVPNRQRRKRR